MPRFERRDPPRHVPPAPGELDISYEDLENDSRHEIGRGSSSVVHRVEFKQPGGSIPIAVKTPDYKGTLAREQFDRFVSEAETWASLSRTDDDTDGLRRGDHVVKLVSSGTEPLPWIAMEYMDGGNLRDILADGDGRLPLEQGLWVGTAVCEGVLHAHRHGVAHLDLKPSNVLFRNSTDGWPFPKVTDWGLAKMLLDENETTKGLTPAYAAPEQFHPDRYGSPGLETDIYQLGVLVYQLTTGRLPFEGAASDIREAKLSEEPPPPSDVADVPPAIDDVLLKALGREKTERHDDIVYFRDNLNALFEQYGDQHAKSQTTVASSEGGTYGEQSASATGEESATSSGVEETPESAVSEDSPASWNEYKRDLENRRENAVLYGLLKKIFYRDIAAEWQHATSRRADAEERYETRATEEARQLLDTLEGQLGDRGEKMFGDSLSDELYGMRSTVEETRVKLEDLLRDHSQYLTTGEREIVTNRRDDLAWYERYLRAKRRLDEAIAESGAKLDEIEARVDEELEEDSLLAAEDQRSLIEELDGVSESLRRVRRSLDTEVLTDQDVGQFDELLRRERSLRDRLERHNTDLAQRRYSTLLDEADTVREQTNDAIGAYRRDGTAFPESTETLRSQLRDQCETIEAFLESRNTEWLSTDQRTRLQELPETLEENQVVVESKLTFERRLSTIQEALSTFQTTIEATLDGESYLDASTRQDFDDRVESLESQLNEIETADLLEPLTDDDCERYDECVATIKEFETDIETYNPTLVQKRYEEHAAMAEETRTTTRNELEGCRQRGGPLPAPAATYVKNLEGAIHTLTSFLSCPQADHLDSGQRGQIESLRSQLADQRTFVIMKDGFESQLQIVHDALADFRLTVDSTLDMETYLTASEHEKLEAKGENIRRELEEIEAEGYLEPLADPDNDRFEACQTVLAELEDRIQRYNNRFVSEESDRLLDGLESLSVDPPNKKQQLAVVRNEPHNRVIAGPGTGKTYSLLCRVRYLVNRGVPSDEILVLAFNTHTKAELNRRLSREFDVTGAEVSTLHSFGQGLVSDTYPGQFVLIGQSRHREIGRALWELCETDESVRTQYDEFRELYRSKQLSHDQQTRRDFYNSLKFQSGKTFRGEQIEASDEESRIAHETVADSLFKYGVEYHYQQYAEWADPADGEPYVPDFTLPTHDITIDYLPSEAASREREWYEQRRPAAKIRNLNSEAGWTSVIIHGDAISQSNIEGVLKAKLEEAGVSLPNPRTEKQRINEAYEHNILRRDVESHLSEFVKKAKINQIEPAAHLDQLDEEENPMRYHFSRVGAAVFDDYEERYGAYGAYDYEDMMLRASEIAQQGTVDDLLDYRHVLVDEFQDLNRVQIELLQAILGQSDDVHLFAVGDDWQSIYGFRGARPEFFVEFEDRFSPATTTRLAINYRCPPAVVQASSALMAESNLESEKSLEAAPSNPETTPTVHVLAGGDDWQYETNVKRWATERVKQSLTEDDRSPDEIMVLARNEEGSPFVPRITKELKKHDIAVNDGRDSVTVTTAHSAKGGEADHVILVNAVSDRSDGFPPEEQESSLTQLVEANEQDHIAEERRLFYMALTRTKDQLDIQTRFGHESTFISPLKKHVAHEAVPIDWATDRVSITGRVQNPNETVSRHRQLGTLVVDNYYIPYVIPSSEYDVDLLNEGQEYRFENIGVGQFRGNPQLRIDDQTSIESL